MAILYARPGPGVHQAANFLRWQLPLIAETFPAVRDCHHGTINVLFEVGLVIARPDHRTSPLKWSPDSNAGREVFDLAEIQLEAPSGSTPVLAWLYIPHGSPHRRTPQIHEILTCKLDLTDVKQFRIHLQRQIIELPYSACPLLVAT